MGMSASQTRFLALTARKTNTEFEGQQVNQERTALANQSAGLFNRMLQLSAPTPPSTVLNYNNVDLPSDPYGLYNDYKILSNALGDVDGTLEINRSAILDEEDYDALRASGGLDDFATYADYTNNLSTILGGYGITDLDALADNREIDISQTIYDQAKVDYDKSIADINAEIEVIQQLDKTLELKLRQLDTEQEALSTEMDAVKKVIDKNIESTFKTFS